MRCRFVCSNPRGQWPPGKHHELQQMSSQQHAVPTTPSRHSQHNTAVDRRINEHHSLPQLRSRQRVEPRRFVQCACCDVSVAVEPIVNALQRVPDHSVFRPTQRVRTVPHLDRPVVRKWRWWRRMRHGCSMSVQWALGSCLVASTKQLSTLEVHSPNHYVLFCSNIIDSSVLFCSVLFRSVPNLNCEQSSCTTMGGFALVAVSSPVPFPHACANVACAHEMGSAYHHPDVQNRTSTCV